MSYFCYMLVIKMLFKVVKLFVLKEEIKDANRKTARPNVCGN